MKYEVNNFYRCKGWYIVVFTNKSGAVHAEQNSSLVWAYPIHTTFMKKEIESHWDNHLKRFVKNSGHTWLADADELFYIVKNDDDLIVKVIAGGKVGWIIMKNFLGYSLVTQETEAGKNV